LQFLLDTLPSAQFGRLLAQELAHELGHPQRRRGALGEVAQELAVVAGVVPLAQPRPQGEQADQLSLADQGDDQLHAGRPQRVPPWRGGL
jgi:hypothetical protein